MTDLVHKNKKYKETLPIFTETIDVEDYNTDRPNTNRIKKLAHSLELSERNKALNKYKGMTLDELRMCKAISNTDGKPSPSLTDEKWQKEFNIRKMFINTYQGYTAGSKSNHIYITDVLKNIQHGQVDYCYFIYQIMDLLKVYPVSLRTRYRDGYWEVWLSK